LSLREEETGLRYDRNVVQNTLKAIKKIEEVRISREAKLWENRMKGNKAKQIKEDARELEQAIHLVKAPLAMQEEPGLTLPTKTEKMKVEVSISKQQKEHSMEG